MTDEGWDEAAFREAWDNDRPIPPYGTPERAAYDAEHDDDDEVGYHGSR